MSAETDYIAYLETKVCADAFRIGELEAALLYVLNMKLHGHANDEVYLKTSLILWDGDSKHFGREMKMKYRELVNE